MFLNNIKSKLLSTLFRIPRNRFALSATEGEEEERKPRKLPAAVPRACPGRTAVGARLGLVGGCLTVTLAPDK